MEFPFLHTVNYNTLSPLFLIVLFVDDLFEVFCSTHGLEFLLDDVFIRILSKLDLSKKVSLFLDHIQ